MVGLALPQAAPGFGGAGQGGAEAGRWGEDPRRGGVRRRGGRALPLRGPPAPELRRPPAPGTRRPGGGGRRNAAMAPRGLPGSAVLAAAVFVGGAVSSPLVAPGEYRVRAGARWRRRGVGAAALLRPELRSSWRGRGVPRAELLAAQARARREARARVPPFPPARLPPSLLSLAALRTCYPQTPPLGFPGCRVRVWARLPPVRFGSAPRRPANSLSDALVLKGPASGRS